MKSDEILVKEIQSGDILAFEELVKRYQGKLFNVARRVLFNDEDAKEAVQDCLFAVYRNIEKIDSNRRFSPYVFAALKNTAVSLLRKKKPVVALTGEETTDEAEVDFWENEKLIKLVNQLKKEEAEAIKLYYFEGLNYEEAAIRMEIPVNTLRTHLRRAKLKLREEILKND